MKKKLPLLIKAIIEDDIANLKSFKDLQDVTEDSNHLSALHIAQLLGRDEIIQELKPRQEQAVFKVKLKDESNFKLMTKAELESFFSITYRPFLRFLTYADIQKAIFSRPLLLRHEWMTKENFELCNTYRDELDNGPTAKVAIKWIDDTLGYGLFADEDFPKDTFIGEYTGVVRKVNKNILDLNEYCFQYPTSLFSSICFVIDALEEGNTTRFINHSIFPNLKPFCLVDRGLLRQVFLTRQQIKKGTQLTWDYGVDYWENRKMVRNIAKI